MVQMSKRAVQERVLVRVGCFIQINPAELLDGLTSPVRAFLQTNFWGFHLVQVLRSELL